MTPLRIFILGVAFTIGIMAALSLRPQQGGNVQTMGQGAVGGPFTLVDHTGKTVTDADFRGRFLLVFFGYTFCPDVCPTELNAITVAMDKLGPLAEKVTPVFITIDPHRDTVEKLKSYVADFHPRLVGLTGSEEQVAAAARAYRVYYKKAGGDKAGEDYLVDHSSYVYLMGPDGVFLTHFSFGVEPGKMAEELRLRIAADKSPASLGGAPS